MLIYPMPRERYEQVKSILVSLGYQRHGEEWEPGEDCVVTHTTGLFMTYTKWHTEQFPCSYQTICSADEFIAKYKKPLDQQKQPEKKLSIKVSDKEEYMLVSEALRDMGYEPDPDPCWSDWDQKIVSDNYHVLTLCSGYSIHNHEGSRPFPDYPFEYHTFTGFMMLFFRSLLKEFEEARTQAQPKVYNGVFSFDQDGANCNNDKQRLYWSSSRDRWAVIDPVKTDPHTLIEAGHEVGCFYLLDHERDPERPTSYGLYDGQSFWRWTAFGEIIKVESATNLKVVKD
jgi:hypothetical protein